MNRRRADTVVGVLLVFVLTAGGTLSWQAFQQRREIEQTMGPMMDSSMGSMHGPDPLWYVIGTLLLAAVLAGVYYVIRDDVFDSTEPREAEPVDLDSPSSGASPSGTDASTQDPSPNPESAPAARVLDLLPDDERRVLEPVLTSPGITQIELRDRSDFSKSKVSQTVSALEERGLLYRERQGRTYRIYPSEDLQDQSHEP